MFKYKYNDLINPLLEALHNLGGSATATDLEDEVVKIMNFNDEDLSDLHIGRRKTFNQRLAWARRYLKRVNLIDNSLRGFWHLTEKGTEMWVMNKVDAKENRVAGLKTMAPSDNNLGVIELKEPVDKESPRIIWQEWYWRL